MYIIDLDDKRKKIISTALRLFITQGFQGTPTSQIAKVSRVATGTLFHYFKTKDDLIEAVFLECKNSFTDSLIAGVLPDD